MKIITVTNFKGGVGKTFLSVVLAELFMAEGKRAVVIDLDRQFCAVEYLRRPDGGPEFKNIDVVPSAGRAPDFATLSGYDVAIVDTPPAAFGDPIVQSMIKQSNLVIVPFMLYRHALIGFQDMIAVLPESVRILPVVSVESGLSKAKSDLLGSVRTALKGDGSAAPVVELPMYDRIDTNLGKKRVFWYGLREREFAPFEALYNTVSRLLS